MQELLLPLVESLVKSYEGPTLAKTKIMGVQHILETTHAMFRSLYKLGLKPENVALIGKCYSTCQEVYNEMIEDGIYVSSGSFAYSSHRAFDELFAQEVQKFLLDQIEDLHSGKYDAIILLDDGGKCLSFMKDHFVPNVLIVGVEQTSSGYEAIRSQKLTFPVINVARSPLKLSIESPMIAQAAADRLFASLQQRNLSPNKALIIGGGAIGQAMFNRLSSDMEITLFDINQDINTSHRKLSDLIPHFPLIIGCTGKTSIPHHLHQLLSLNTTLVSVSSADREFDAVHLRRLLPENHNCLIDLKINSLLLIHGGFPVNFDGKRENIEPGLIQLTIALITAGILQARKNGTGLASGILNLHHEYEAKVENEFKGSYIV